MVEAIPRGNLSPFYSHPPASFVGIEDGEKRSGRTTNQRLTVTSTRQGEKTEGRKGPLIDSDGVT